MKSNNIRTKQTKSISYRTKLKIISLKRQNGWRLEKQNKLFERKNVELKRVSKVQIIWRFAGANLCVFSFFLRAGNGSFFVLILKEDVFVQV